MSQTPLISASRFYQRWLGAAPERAAQVAELVRAPLDQLDFAAVVRARPLWDVLVIVLCVTGALSALTGVVLGWRRLRR